MIAPYKWMCDYVDMDLPADELAQRLIMTGTAVDGYKKLGASLENVVAARIKTIKKHPEADKLSICQVDTGAEELQIVCGAKNIYEGALVPAALIGANLPGDFKISKSKLRGVYSFGMLCSGEELGLTAADYPTADVDGIMILQGDDTPGTPLREVLGLNDTVFEIEVGANRPDCLSVLGVARECAASLNKSIKLPELSYTEGNGSIDDYVKVTVDDGELCERYVARAVKNVKIAPSPKWLRDRLTSAGVRSINNIVDITNFVMLEMGQPMHAFDHKDIRGSHIIVRRARQGETIVTLDSKERALTEDMLLICDAQGPIGIAGIMGGENSEIKEDTTTVIFEAAKFRQGNARRTSRSLGLQTESAMRFSKGIDTAGCKNAMDRALHLVELLGAGDIVPGEIDIVSADLSPRTVTVAADRINSKLGTEIDAQDMACYLRSVFIPTTLADGVLTCSIPSFRGDISMGDDIAEEVARMYGYNNIPVQSMTGLVKRGVYSAEEASVDKARKLLTNLGCFECITYSFAATADYEKLNLPADDKLRRMVRILNPLGEDQALLRTSPLPDMLKVTAGNLNRKVKDIRLFESGRVYLPTIDGGELPEERKYISIALCGEEEDFFSLKGIVQNLLDAFGIRGTKYMADGAEYFHPGRRASVYAGGEKLGELGEIHPDVSGAFGISKRVYFAELWLIRICEAADEVVKYEPLPKYPAMERDIALIVNEEVPAGDLLDCIRVNAGPYFESAALFDVYTGERLGEGKKSLAFSIVLRAKDRTLMDEEAAASIDAVVNAAQAEFGAKLRD